MCIMEWARNNNVIFLNFILCFHHLFCSMRAKLSIIYLMPFILVGGSHSINYNTIATITGAAAESRRDNL